MACKSISAAAIGSLFLLATAQAGRADQMARADDDGDEIPFEQADVFLELNDTDGDLGIQALIDGEAWKRLEIKAPNERPVLFIRAMGRLRQQGLTELTFESAEPSFEELEPEEFFRRFPEGTFEIKGTTLEGGELKSTAELTHVLPAPPENIRINGQPAAEDCDVKPLPSVPLGSVTIRWDAVERSHPDIGVSDPSIEIAGYQVVVEREEPSLLVFSIDLPPEVTRVRVPRTFTNLGDEFKFEVAVREAGGNQTVVESCFVVEAAGS